MGVKSAATMGASRNRISAYTRDFKLEPIACEV